MQIVVIVILYNKKFTSWLGIRIPSTPTERTDKLEQRGVCKLEYFVINFNQLNDQ